MKKDIHPAYGLVVFRDATTGDMFRTRSTITSRRTVEYEGATYPLVDVEISSWPHPLWTGRARLAERGGAVEKFRRRYGDRGRSAGA